ncbi:MAG: substrate-binding domain-containing protein [Acidilobaceae archaeon]|nr:substrate-binding domain-containing protein [Acidilobaceae archaeon]MCX8165059.1 substrate-binding domain-containing protein [Acidilobaceae archaeon]MDW7974424.1 substrate-binding domain-containing protein [Sulfolobales archaeon]
MRVIWAAGIAVAILIALSFLVVRDRECEELIIYADIAFRPILELAAESNHGSCVNQVINSGPTGAVLSSIRLQRKGDVYASVSALSMRQAILEGHVRSEDVRVIAYLKLDIVVQKGNPLGIKGLRDLVERKGLRLALAEPESVAAGQLARELLSSLRLGNKTYWELILESHEVVFKRSAPDVFNSVKLGLVDAGLTYEVYYKLDPQGADMVKIEDELNLRVNPVTAAVLRYSNNRERAEAFISIFESPGVRSRLRELGYILPEELNSAAPFASPISYKP